VNQISILNRFNMGVFNNISDPPAALDVWSKTVSMEKTRYGLHVGQSFLARLYRSVDLTKFVFSFDQKELLIFNDHVLIVYKIEATRVEKERTLWIVSVLARGSDVFNKAQLILFLPHDPLDAVTDVFGCFAFLFNRVLDIVAWTQHSNAGIFHNCIKATTETVG